MVPATRPIICLTECSRSSDAEAAAEVLLGDDVGRVLRPRLGELDAALLEGGVLRVADDGVADLPLDRVERMLAGLREPPLDGDSIGARAALHCGGTASRHELSSHCCSSKGGTVGYCSSPRTEPRRSSERAGDGLTAATREQPYIVAADDARSSARRSPQITPASSAGGGAGSRSEGPFQRSEASVRSRPSSRPDTCAAPSRAPRARAWSRGRCGGPRPAAPARARARTARRPARPAPRPGRARWSATPGADVHGAVDVGLGGQQVCLHDVADVHVVARLQPVAEHRRPAAVEHLAAEDRDHAGLPERVLARPVDVAVAQRDRRQAVQAVKQLRSTARRRTWTARRAPRAPRGDPPARG